MPHEFTARSRTACQQAGIDIERSYKTMQLEIRMGGPVQQRLQIMLNTGLERENSREYRGRPVTGTLNQSPIGEGRRRRNTEGEYVPYRRGTPTPITASERTLLSRLAAGGTVEGHARETGRSIQTTKSQMRSVLHKLGARNRTHAVAIAIRTGTIAAPNTHYDP